MAPINKPTVGQPGWNTAVDAAIDKVNAHDANPVLNADTTGAAVGKLLAPTAVSGGAVTGWGLIDNLGPGLASGSNLLAGRTWAFLGDSITNGSSAAAGRSFVDYVSHLVGTALISPPPPASNVPAGAQFSIRAGVPGERSDQILARVPAVLAQHPKGVVVLAGPNDAGQSVPVATFLANIAAICSACRQAGVPVVLGTVPPRGASASAALHALTAAYNLALRAWAADNRIPLANVAERLTDPTTGALLAAYDSGDALHPNSAGHFQVGRAFAAAISPLLPSQPGIVYAKQSAAAVGLVSNTLFPGNRTGWFEQPGGTGTAPTYSNVVDTTGRLPATAQWAEMFFDATAAGGQRIFASGLSGTGWAVGDNLLLAAKMDIVDVAGFAAAAEGNSATAFIKPQLVDQAGVSLPGQSGLPPMGRAPGDIAVVAKVPAGTTGLNLWIQVVAPTGTSVKVRISAVDVLNLTALGVTGF